MSKHTPGPWKSEWSRKYQQHNIFPNAVKGQPRCSFATVYDCGGEFEPDETAANARLIAAAPDLLESVRDMVQMIESGDEHGAGSQWHLQARAAIAKAEGRAA